MTLEYPLILEIHLELFQKEYNSFNKKVFLICKNGKVLKRGGGGRSHLMTPGPHPLYDDACSDVLQNKRSPKFCNIERKTSMSEETLRHMFFCEYCEIFKNSFFIEHIWWLLLKALVENTNLMIFDHIFPSIS